MSRTPGPWKVYDQGVDDGPEYGCHIQLAWSCLRASRDAAIYLQKVTCPRCSHLLKAHGSGVLSLRTQTGSVETPAWFCARCDCRLTEWPRQAQAEMW